MVDWSFLRTKETREKETRTHSSQNKAVGEGTVCQSKRKGNKRSLTQIRNQTSGREGRPRYRRGATPTPATRRAIGKTTRVPSTPNGIAKVVHLYDAGGGRWRHAQQQITQRWWSGSVAGRFTDGLVTSGVHRFSQCRLSDNTVIHSTPRSRSDWGRSGRACTSWGRPREPAPADGGFSLATGALQNGPPNLAGFFSELWLEIFVVFVIHNPDPPKATTEGGLEYHHHIRVLENIHFFYSCC